MPGQDSPAQTGGHMTAYSSLDAFIAGGSTAQEKPSQEAAADDQVDNSDTTSQDASAGAEETSEGTEDASAEESAPAEKDEYEFKVTGPEGEKLLKFDLNDKERIKKALPLAYAARDFQARANRAEDKLKNLEAKLPKLQDVQSKMGVLNKAWEEKGEEGVIDLLGGKPGHFQEWLKAKFEQLRQYEEASPVERERLDTIAEAERLKKELERERNLRTKEQEQLAKDKDEAETRSLENQLHPAFNKFRFAGKLGDESTEEFYDKALWRETMEALDALPADQVTTSRIEAEFRRNYERAARVIQQKAAEKTKKVIETKKKEALKGAKVAVKKGLKAPTDEEKRIQNIKSGRWTDAILGSLGVR